MHSDQKPRGMAGIDVVRTMKIVLNLLQFGACIDTAQCPLQPENSRQPCSTVQPHHQMRMVRCLPLLCLELCRDLSRSAYCTYPI